MKEIYLDHAATTYLDPRVEKEMQPFWQKIFANPGSLHSPGLRAKEAVKKARENIAKIINAEPKEIIFTSGGTESINLAIKGVALQKKVGHIITTQIEHPAVLSTCAYLEKLGFAVTYLPVDQYGLIHPNQVEKSIRSDTILISIMYANNEIGTIEPIAEIGKLVQQYKIPFHTDACQAGSLELDVEKLKVDMLTLNGSKIYGPKGIGILFKKKN